MDYLKITIQFTPFEEWLADVLKSQMGEIGFESFVDNKSGFDAYLPENLFSEENLNVLLEQFAENFTFSVNREIIKSQNWNEVWEKNYFKPLVIGDCVVRAPFHNDFPEKKYEIIIEPNMAFGTGNHETTSMMLEYILNEKMENKTILDMGCGTGILGILASMKGAEKITAIDIDIWSFNGTKENSTLNNIQNIKVIKGDAKILGDENYDIIFANIQKNVLISDLPVYAKCMNPGSSIFLSGFYLEDLPAIKTQAEKQGLTDSGYKIKNNWIAAKFTKAN